MAIVEHSRQLNEKYAYSKSALELVKGVTSGDRKKRKPNFTSRAQDQTKKGSSSTLVNI